MTTIIPKLGNLGCQMLVERCYTSTIPIYPDAVRWQVANPGEHLERLLGRSPSYVVARDGSPSGGHVYVLWNPMEFGNLALDG